MAKFFENEKRRKRALTALSALLAATLSFGVFAACGTTEEPKEEDDPVATPTDTQTIKNGNFEFFSEMTEDDLDEKRTFISTPTSWSYTSGSPSSNTRSGLILASEWDYLTKHGFSESGFRSVDEAAAHWTDEKVTLYDRLKFYDEFKTEISELEAGAARDLFNKYSYSIDYEDVEHLSEDVGEKFDLHEGVKLDDEGNPAETGVLMIHNYRESDGVYGTAQYYTSSTTITLSAGTAAELSVWVRTNKLERGYEHLGAHPVTENGGAYVGVVNTVGSKTLDELQIKNINTDGEWQQYSLYIRANTFASTTFRIKLGLGQGASDNRDEAVNGYAFFDDLTCKIITAQEYEEKISGFGDTVEERSIEDTAKDKLFDATKKYPYPDNKIFALDLLEDDLSAALDVAASTTDLTEEKSETGSSVWTSEDKGFGKDEENLAGVYNYANLKSLSASNKYLKTIFEKDFEEKFPFYNADGEVNTLMDVVMLLSRGAAYTTKLSNGGNDTFTLQPDEYMLISFFVKTSEIRTGRSGAGAILYDGLSKTTISPFDSTTLSTIDITNEDEADCIKDIYSGWTQCFFFVANETDGAKDFRVELTYGPTAIASSTVNSYGDGYAAFTNFETRTLTKTEYGYVSTGDRAKKVSLTGGTERTTKFDDASEIYSIEDGLALPSSFRGVQAGSNSIVPNEYDDNGELLNPNPSYQSLKDDGMYTGLLSYKYAKNYAKSTEPWKTALDKFADDSVGNDWWSSIFGDSKTVASQPLVILNTEKAMPSYGFFAEKASISANSYQRISVRLKLSANLTARVYLTDVSDMEKGFNNGLAPSIPNVTYWYDDNGNLCASDPTDKDFDEETGILYYLEENGLYTKADKSDDKYYANLNNYKLKDGNLVTKDDTIAFYGKETDGKTVYYAHYDADKNVYSLPVENFPADTPTRYTALNDYTSYESVITVDGSEAGVAGKWVTVTFYLHTGNEAKDYRLEIWAGDRNDRTGEGLPKDAYLFVDSYLTGSSNYDSVMEEAEELLRENENNLNPDNEEQLREGLALYYTFTFYDSPSYLRYDKSTDSDDAGNPWRNYKQSNYSEQLIYLYFRDLEGANSTGDATIFYFLDYAATEVTVERAADPGTSDNGGNHDHDDDHDNDFNIWLAISSSLLAVVLVVVMVILLVRFLRKKYGRSGPKPAKAKKKTRPVVVV